MALNNLERFAGAVDRGVFFRTLADCETSYADKRGGRGGIYQSQEGVTPARVSTDPAEDLKKLIRELEI